MITDALTSCAFLLIGSGSSIYRLTKYSSDNYSAVLPKFLLASLGIGILGARSIFTIVYNFFWRQYPIDPLMIEAELLKPKKNRNIIDWILSKFGIGTIIYSLYEHHNCVISGTIVLSTLASIEVVFLIDEFISSPENNNTPTTDLEELKNLLGGQVNYLWIISNDLFGQAVSNGYFRLANFAYLISIIYQPDNQSWSIKNSINDYMMLLFVILSTESLIQNQLD